MNRRITRNYADDFSTIGSKDQSDLKSESAFGNIRDQEGDFTKSEEVKSRQIREEKASRVQALRSGRRIRLYFGYIPAGKVEALTIVHPLNTRNPATVNDELCQDIMPSIASEGVRMEVLATRDTDTGILSVFNGQRRRYCAIKTNQGLPYSYTDEELTRREIKELSHIANLNKSNSLYDLGRYYLEDMAEENLTTAVEYAELTGLSTANISYALTAARIPLEIFHLFPSKTGIGRPTIQSISRLLKEVNGDRVTKLITLCKEAGEQTSDEEAKRCFEDLVIEVLERQNQQKKYEPVQIANILVVQKSPTKVELNLPEGFSCEDLLKVLKNHFSD
jgi:hypothetical protein